MAENKDTIIKELKEHIKNRGGAYSDWYTGIAENARERLGGHKVNLEEDKWAYRVVTSSDVARVVERYFTEILGTDGGSGGGTSSSKSVYIYKKNNHTDP